VADYFSIAEGEHIEDFRSDFGIRALDLAPLTTDVSEQNVELARRATEAYNAHDLEALIALYDPQIELHSTFAAVGGAVYHGHDGVRKYFRDLEEAWEGETHIEPEAFFDLGEYTLAFNVLRGRGRQSGAEVAMPVALVARWRDGLMVYFKGYAHREDALSDLGVSKEALEPIAP
jgi:ketosteroid isomerase-like protein